MPKGLFHVLSKKLDLHFTTRPGLRGVLRNSAWLFGDHFLKSVLGLIVGVWVARYLGTAGYGVLNYAIAFTALAAPLAHLGLQTVVVRDIVVRPAGMHATLGTSFFLRVMGAAIGLFLIYGAIVLLRPGDKLTITAVMMLAVSGVVQSLSITAWWFESQVRSKNTVLSQNIVFVTGTALRVALIVFGAPLLAFAALIALEMALSTVAVAIAYHFAGERIARWRVELARAKALLSDSWPFMLSGVAVTIYMKIDIIMIGEMSGTDDVGIYSAALRLSEPWYLIPTALVSSAFPYLVKSRAADRQTYQDKVGELCRVLAMLAHAIAIFMTFASGFLIGWLFGAAFASAAPILAVHIWACHAVFLGVAYNAWISAENLGVYALMATAAGAALNVALNWFLIPIYGVLGAALATIISYWFVIFAMPFMSIRTRPMGAVLIKALIPVPFATRSSRL
jgi:polysaccharide transporter, PST family